MKPNDFLVDALLFSVAILYICILGLVGFALAMIIGYLI